MKDVPPPVPPFTAARRRAEGPPCGCCNGRRSMSLAATPYPIRLCPTCDMPAGGPPPHVQRA